VSNSPEGAPEGDASFADTVGSSAVRAALDLTQHQLGEYTAGLRLDVGDRPNYPRYRRPDFDLMVAVSALREVRAPLDVALRAAADYREQVIAARGWLLTSPEGDSWSAGFVSNGPDLLGWLRASGGRAVILDLGRIADRAVWAWTRAVAYGG
jgi:hypothetical protein